MRVLACSALAAGVLGAAPAAAQPRKVSTEKDRKEVSITVYNQSFGLVREVRSLDLVAGRQSLELADVAATIQPETVAIRALAGKLDVLEQNYRYDLLSPATLLDKYVGQKVRAYRYHPGLGTEQGFDAELLSVADGRPILRIGGELSFDFPGRLAFPGVPPNLIAKPSLVWLLLAGQPKMDVEVTYLAHALNWSADYVVVVDDKDQKGDLTGWVTLTNQSGASYANAKLKLVAGDVNRVRPELGFGGVDDVTEENGKRDKFQEESLFEYHLYTLERPTDVLQNEQKQVTLLEARGVGLEKKLLFFGQQYWYRGQYGELQSNQKVGVYLDLRNTQKNGLGMPLPKGVVRVYKADASGARQFVGEDRIDHTPKDEKVRIKMGEAFDVVGSRKQTEWRALGSCTSESAWEIELRNHKDTEAAVEVWEPIGGDWKLLEQSHPSVKKDASTFTFEVKVPANGKTTITYRVRVRWC
ncbi:MAG: DUF4139 domain-containing protein [Myxococcales bacterium]|nr:DUF4139 domain-containing protein [Myxococcales bacterium]